METIKEVKTSKYKQLNVLGRGSFGTVYKVEKKELFGKVYALKEILLSSNQTNRNKESDEVSKEFKMQFELNHRNVTRVFEVFKESDYLNIVMEYCESDLQKYIDNPGVFMKFYSKMIVSNSFKKDSIEFNSLVRRSIAISWIPQFIEGISYIHSMSITHRDIKPGNILLSYDVNQYVPKISDFGNSTRDKMAYSYAGTQIYDAPELWNDDIKSGYDSLVDVFSLGIVIIQTWFCFTLEQLSELLSIVQMNQWDRNPDLAPSILLTLKKSKSEDEFPENLFSLLLTMIAKKSDRLNSKDLLAHPTVDNFKNMKLFNKSKNSNIVNQNYDMKTLKPKKSTHKEIGRIGQGTFGTVFKAQQGDSIIAVKKICIQFAPDEISTILNEFNNQQSLVHENIARVYDVFVDKIHFLNITMEFCEYNLDDLFEKPNEFFKSGSTNGLANKQSFVYDGIIQLLKGLRHIHSNRIIHRDLKPANILLQKNEVNGGKFQWIFKITDFGLSKFCSANTMKARTYVGTPFYNPPEMWSAIYGQTPTNYTDKVDIWSMGIVFFQLSLELNAMKLTEFCVKKITESTYTTEDSLMDLLEKMLVLEENRLSSEALLVHPTISLYQDYLKTKPVRHYSKRHNTSSSTDYLLRFFLLGDSDVGKREVLYRFANITNPNSFSSTIGIDVEFRTMEIDDYNVKLKFEYSAGQERFATITTSYYRGSNGIILIYDVTQVSTYELVKKWLLQIVRHGNENLYFVLIGNYCDRENDRKVSKEEAQSFANEYKIQYLEFSSDLKEPSQSTLDEFITTMGRTIIDNLNSVIT